MNKSFFIALLAIIVIGCGGDDGISSGGESTPAEKIAALEESGTIPQLDRSDSIAGGDRDSDGIRDDIEAFIDVNYSSAPQRAAVLQSAKALQEAILIDVSDVIAVKEINRKISRADHCIYSKFDGESDSKQPAQVSQEIESLMTNTKERLLAYLAFSKALDGTSWTTPEGDTCE